MKWEVAQRSDRPRLDGLEGQRIKSLGKKVLYSHMVVRLHKENIHHRGKKRGIKCSNRFEVLMEFPTYQSVDEPDEDICNQVFY